MKPNIFSKKDFFILFFILMIAFIFRLYKINIPLADLHSWRQADTAAVARNFVKNGFDLFHPRYDDLSSNQTGYENPKGYRFVEFPIYNAVVAFFYKNIPLVPIEVYGRILSSLFSLLIIITLYYLCLKEANRSAAIFSSLIYAVFPFFVFFSRTVLPETTAISMAFFSILILYLSVNKKSIKSVMLLTLSCLSFAISILIKPTTIFYGLSLLIIFLYQYKWQVFKKIHVYLFFAVACIPLVLWRLYILQYPEGIPFSEWLITSVNTYEGLKNIFFKPAFFRWIFFERINNYILGGYLSFFFILGIIKKPKKIFLHGIILSGFFYLFVFQGGNVQHEYYQTILLPAIALAVGLGISEIISNIKLYLHPIVSYSIICATLCLSFFFSYYKVKDYYNYPNELPQIANIVNTLTNSNDKIVTDRMGDTTLLYLMDRKGAPSIYKSPEELKKIGYNYLVTMSKGQIEDMKNQKFEIVFENNVFTLFKL